MKAWIILFAFGLAPRISDAADAPHKPIRLPPCGAGPLERHHDCNILYTFLMFTAPEGSISFSFPVDNLRPGELISAAVEFATFAKTEPERAAAMAKLKKLKIRWNVNGESLLLNSSIIATKVPELGAANDLYFELVDEHDQPVLYPKGLPAPFEFSDKAGKEQKEHLKPSVNDLPESDYRGPGIFVLFEKIPEITRLRFPRRPLRPAQIQFPILQPASAVTRIQGPFHGDLNGTTVFFDGKPVVPLVETEDEILLDPPVDTLGRHEIEIVEAEKHSRGIVQYFSVEAKADPAQNSSEGSLPVRFQIRGLEGMRGPANLVLADHTSFQRYARIQIQGAAPMKTKAITGRLAAAAYSIPVSPNSISSGGTIDKDIRVFLSGSVQRGGGHKIDLARRPLDPGILKELFIGSDAEFHNSQNHLVSSPLLEADLLPDTDEPVTTIVTSAIVSWEQDNGVSVAPDAQSFIVAGFTNRSADIKENIDEYDRAGWLLQSYISSLVRCYLYDVQARSSADKKNAPAAAQKFFDNPLPAHSVILYKDVHSYPVEQFLVLWWRLTKGNGWIELDSPSPLFVFLDEKMQKQKTNTPVMLSFGEHTLELSGDAGQKAINCILRIFVIPGPQQSYYCTPNAPSR